MTPQTGPYGGFDMGLYLQFQQQCRFGRPETDMVENFLALSSQHGAGAPPGTSKPRNKKELYCDVCGDAALGKHYGVLACNGCKGFFRRSVFSAKKYKCRYDNRCIVAKEQRNACRACRLKRCLAVGMNPRAVQNERSDADKAEGEGTSQQHVISVSTYLNNSGGGGEEDDYDDDPSERERRSVDIQTDNFELSGAIEIDANSISPALLKKELPSIGDETERFLRELLDLEQQVMERVDDVEPPANPTLTNRNFATVFYNPNLLCSRSKISPTGERIAVLVDTTHDWRRCFVLYADFLQALPDFQRLSPDDRIKLAEARYPSYHWFVVANWTVKTGCNGVCYCNESYFPRDPSLQCMFDQRRCTERMFHLLVEPLRELNLNEEERVIMCVVAIFSVPVPDMSDEGAAILGNIRQRYLDVLHRYMVNTYAGMDADLYAAVRMGNLLVLLSSITELVHLTGDNIRLNDVLHIMDFDKFGSAVRDIYDKAL